MRRIEVLSFRFGALAAVIPIEKVSEIAHFASFKPKNGHNVPSVRFSPSWHAILAEEMDTA